MDRDELVEKAARAIRSAYIEYCDAIDPVLDAQLAGDVSEWHGEAEAAVDAILPDVIEHVQAEAAQIAEGGIDPAFDRELGASWQRSKIAAAIRAAVLGDALTTKES